MERKIEEMEKKFRSIMDVFGIEKYETRISELERATSSPDFWNDPQNAGRISKELEDLKKEVERIVQTEKRLETVRGLAEISEGEKDKKDIQEEIRELEKAIDELEFRTLFDGPYDRNDAIISIYSGAGGVDAQDWAEMIMRMYLRWAEVSDMKARVVEETKGQEAGIKNATIEISGSWAYGNLKSESGVHRLVRLSPFNSANLRQTSFALVEILPVIEKIEEVEIRPEDLKIDVYRASGAGGQHVNTTDSAVRITHLPTNTVVTCQNERSQLQNKESAMKILKAKLHQKYLEEQEAEKRKLRGEQKSAEWGSQIRSYVIHPYKMVKDHRTKHETSDTDSVFAGNLKEFMEQYLKWIKK